MSFDLITDKNKKVHFIGIGGVSMSGLAAVLLNAGYKVSGSDFKDSDILNTLKSHGAEIYIGHKADNLKNVDLIVYTAAIPSDNPELVEAKKKNIELMDRAEFLGQIMKGHKYNVAVAGTHGKTTTTSMVSHIALSADLDPTILVGGNLDVIDGNFRVGNSEYFITEACEYKQSFLRFFPYVGIILNIDADHLDFYKDLNHIKETFKEFINIIPKDGYAIVNIDDKNVRDILDKPKCNIITYGINEGDVTAKNLVCNEKGAYTFDAYNKDKFLGTISLSVPGLHNVSNALSAVSLGLIFNIPFNKVQDGLLAFHGAHKRFEYKGIKDGITVIDDYAHHPVEIKATLATAKLIKHNKTYCVFQPHTYTRTKTLFDEFTTCFGSAYELILMDIYAAREKDTGLVSSNELGDAIRKTGMNCINVHSHEEAVNYLSSKVVPGDLILTVGAGDVVKVGEMLLNK